MEREIKTMTTVSTLYILADENVKDLYQNHSTYHSGDSGLDLFFPEDVDFYPGETKFVNLGIKCEMVERSSSDTYVPTRNASYFLYPRSSISKTPLMLKNSVGIFDAQYRGYVIAALLHVGADDMHYKVKSGDRLVQICARNLEPFGFKLVNELSETSRGEGGFGSTGK